MKDAQARLTNRSEADAAQMHMERFGEWPVNLSAPAIRVLKRRGLPFKTVQTFGRRFVFYSG